MTHVKGLLIVNEGPDGTGKKTQTDLLCQHLTHDGHAVCRFDFPAYGETPFADLIQTLLREKKDVWRELPWEDKALLFAQDRHTVFARYQTLLRIPVVTVCNRYVPSNQAHMAGYSDESWIWSERFDWIEQQEYEVLGIPRPDIIFLHSWPQVESHAGLLARGGGVLDVHEEDRLYLQRVAQCFVVLAERDPERWRFVPGAPQGILESPENIHTRLWDELIRHPAWLAYVERVPV